MIIKFEDIPHDLLEYTDASLPEEAFADDVNRIFPIKDPEDVIAAFEVMKNIPYNHYSATERLYMLDRIVAAAVANKVELEFEETLGGENMIDTKSKEFQDAVAAAVKVENETFMADLADEDKRAAAKQEYETTVKALLAEKNEAVEAMKTAKSDQEKAEQDFTEFKTEIEVKARITERIDELKSAGMELEDWTGTEEAVAEMSDKVFTMYKEQVLKVKSALHDKEEDMKKEDEKKNKKLSPEELKKLKDEKQKAKASDDIVKESQKEGVLPNGETKASTTEDDEFPVLTKWLNADYGTKVIN